LGWGKLVLLLYQAVERRLKDLIQIEKKEKEKLKQQLIKGYQTQTKSKKLQQELKTMEQVQFENNE